MEFRDDVFLGMKQPLSLPLMNGGGCCKTVADVEFMAQSPLIGAIVVGSITMEERSGNQGDVFWTDHERGASLNSLGMPNGGERYLFNHLTQMVEIAHHANKALVVNVAGFKPGEYGILANTAFNRGADAVELNFGCPNVIGGDMVRKPILSFSPEGMNKAISMVGQVAESFRGKPVWVKVSPYTNPENLRDAAHVVNLHPCVKAVTMTNSIPNGYATDEKGASRITTGLAGISGPVLKYMVEGNIRQWRDILKPSIEIIAVGGIRSGRDIEDYRLVGADAYQMTTDVLKKGRIDLAAFERVVTEYNYLSENSLAAAQ